MAIEDPGPRAAMMDQVTLWVRRQVAPPKQFPWGRPQPRGGALEALSLGGARKALNWTEPAKKVSWARPAGALESRTGQAGALESRTEPAGVPESQTL